MRSARFLLVLGALLAAVLLITWLIAEDSPQHDDPVLESDDTATARGPGPASRTADEVSGSGRGHDARTGTRSAADRAAAMRITGEVVDETGRGLADAVVTVAPVHPASLRGAPYPDLPVVGTARSDRDGRFSIAPVPTGRWLRVTASRAGYATVGRIVPTAGTDLVLVLPPAAGLDLEVVDPEDHAVAEAQIHARAGDTTHTATTGADGRVVFEALAPGPVQLRLLMPKHGATRAGPYRLRAGETAHYVVVVPRAVLVEGVILDDTTGKPIAEAFVRLAHPGYAETATTNSAGQFGPLPGGGLGERILIAVDAPGYAAALEPVVLRAEGTQTTVVRLVPGEAWSGRVVDATGRAVAGATVAYTSDGIAAPGRLAETTSDARGAFTLGPPPPPAPGRRVVLVARAGGSLGALALRPGQPRPASLILTLARGTTVSGRVVDAKGRALGGASVRLHPEWSEVARQVHPDEDASRLHAFNAIGNQGLAAATGADGTWRIDGVPPGPYRLVVQHAHQSHTRPEIVRVEGTAFSAGLETLAGLDLTGTVVDARGAGIPGASIVVASAADRRNRTKAATDSQGRFRVQGLAPGPYSISAALGGRPAQRRTVELTDGAATDVRITLDEAAEVQLQVLRGDAPYRGLLTLSFGDAASGRTAARRRTLRVKGGRAVLADVPPGTWTLEAFAPAGLRARVVEVEVEAGRSTPIRVVLTPGAVLHGRVLTADAAPVPNAHLTLAHTPTGGRLSATADAAGRYRFEALAPGDYELTFRGRGGALSVESFLLTEGERRTLDATLDPAGTLQVRVVDGRGRPVTGARVRVRRGNQTLRTRRASVTDAQGQATYEDVPAGLVQVLAQGPDGASGLSTAEVLVKQAVQVEVVLNRAVAPKAQPK